MITLIHGDNVLASRRALNDIVSSFDGEIITLESKSLDITDYSQATNSQAMFSTKRLVIIENLLSAKKKIAVDFDHLDCQLILYESKKLYPNQIPQIKTLRVQEFRTDPLIFKFVDSLRPGNGKNLIPLYRQCLKTSEPEFVFAMIIRQLKLTKLFPPGKLKLIYEKLLDLDYKNKTGQLPGSFQSNLEIFIYESI